jgi:hypothetical protein
MRLGIVVMAGAETHEGLARVVAALEMAREFRQAGDEVAIVFEGAGTEWAASLPAAEHNVHALYATVADCVRGACEFCAGAFGVKDRVESHGVPLLGDHDGHPSMRALVAEGYQIATF